MIHILHICSTKQAKKKKKNPNNNKKQCQPLYLILRNSTVDREILSCSTLVGVGTDFSQNSFFPHTITYIVQKSHHLAVKYMSCLLDSARPWESTKETLAMLLVHMELKTHTICIKTLTLQYTVKQK